MAGDNVRVVVHGVDDLRLDSAPEPIPGETDAVVEIAYGGICGSDLHYWRHGAAGESILREPLVLGHEVVGRVLRAAADGSGPAVGSAVAVHPATTAGRHPAGRPNLASEGTYLGSAARLPHTQGAFARRIALPSRMLRPVPEGLPLRTAALAEPAGVALHALTRAGEMRGRRALVIGCGPIGALIVAALSAAGASEIIAVDLADRPLQLARSLGAHEVLRADEADAIAALEADVVFESSGSPRGLTSAIRGAVRGGRVVLVGLQPSGEQPVLIASAISRELDLVGSFRFVDEITDAIRLLADGSLAVEGVVTHVFGVEDAAEAFATALDPAVSTKVLLDFSASTTGWRRARSRR